MDDAYLKRSRQMAQLLHVAQQMYRAVNAMVQRFELTESQYNALRVLRGAERKGDDLTQAELAERLIASRANTTWILDKLEERKLIRRKGHSDRRKNLVEITAAGHKLLARIDPEFAALLGDILRDVDDAALEQAVQTMRRLRFDAPD